MNGVLNSSRRTMMAMVMAIAVVAVLFTSAIIIMGDGPQPVADTHEYYVEYDPNGATIADTNSVPAEPVVVGYDGIISTEYNPEKWKEDSSNQSTPKNLDAENWVGPAYTATAILTLPTVEAGGDPYTIFLPNGFTADNWVQDGTNPNKWTHTATAEEGGKTLDVTLHFSDKKVFGGWVIKDDPCTITRSENEGVVTWTYEQNGTGYYRETYDPNAEGEKWIYEKSSDGSIWKACSKWKYDYYLGLGYNFYLPTMSLYSVNESGVWTYANQFNETKTWNIVTSVIDTSSVGEKTDQFGNTWYYDGSSATIMSYRVYAGAEYLPGDVVPNMVGSLKAIWIEQDHFIKEKNITWDDRSINLGDLAVLSKLPLSVTSNGYINIQNLNSDRYVNETELDGSIIQDGVAKITLNEKQSEGVFEDVTYLITFGKDADDTQRQDLSMYGTIYYITYDKAKEESGQYHRHVYYVNGKLPSGTYRSDAETNGTRLYIGTEDKVEIAALNGDVIFDSLIFGTSDKDSKGSKVGTHAATAYGIFADGHTLIIGTQVKMLNRNDTSSVFFQVFGGGNTSNILNYHNREMVFATGDMVGVKASTCVIIHSGIYYNVVAGNYEKNIGDNNNPRSTYLVMKGGAVTDSVFGGNNRGDIYSGVNDEKLSEGTYVYLTGAFLAGDNWVDTQTGDYVGQRATYKTDNKGNQDVTVVIGGSNKNSVKGSTHVFITDHASVYDAAGAGREEGAKVNSSFMEVSGKAIVRHAVCGGVMNGMSKSSDMIKHTHVTAMGDCKIASLFGAGYDIYFLPANQSMLGGTVNIDVLGGTIGNVYGGGYRGSIGNSSNYDDLNITINIEGGQILEAVYGGGSGGVEKAKHADTMQKNKTNMTNSSDPGFKDSTGASYVYGKITINITGGIIGVDGVNNGNVYGGGKSLAALQNYRGIGFNDGTESDKVPPRSSRSVAKVFGETNINISGDALIKGDVYGGGRGIKWEHNGGDNFTIVNEGSFMTKLMSKDNGLQTVDWYLGDSNTCTYRVYLDYSENEGITGKYLEYAEVEGRTNVTMSGGHVMGDVYGGGANGRVTEKTGDVYYNGSTNVTITGGIIDKAVFGGGLGIENIIAVDGNRVVYVDYEEVDLDEPHSNIIKGSIYGGSRDGNDGLNKTSTSTVVIGQAIIGDPTTGDGSSVYGGGFMGTSFGSTFVYVGYYYEDGGLTPTINNRNDRDTVFLNSIYAGGDITKEGESAADPFTKDLVKGSGTVNVYGNGNNGDFYIKGSIMGSGNSCNTKGYKTINIDSLDISDKTLYSQPVRMTGIHRADILTITQSELDITSRGTLSEVIGSASGKDLSIFDIKEMYLKYDSVLTVRAPMDKICSFYSYSKDNKPTTVTSPSNKLINAVGTTFYVRDMLEDPETGHFTGVKYGPVVGYTVLESLTDQSFGSYVIGDRYSTGGFVVAKSGTYREADYSIMGNNLVKCWFLAGTQNKVVTMNLDYRGGNESVSSASLDIVKMQSGTSMRYTGTTFTSVSTDKNGHDFEFIRPGTEKEGYQFGMVIGYGASSSTGTNEMQADTKRYLQLADNGDGTYDYGWFNGTYYSEDPEEANGSYEPMVGEETNPLKTLTRLAPVTMRMGSDAGTYSISLMFTGKPENTTLYVGYLTISLQEIENIEYEAMDSSGNIIKQTNTMVTSNVNIRVDLYVIGSGTIETESGYTVVLKGEEVSENVLSGFAEIIVPKGYISGKLVLKGVSTNQYVMEGQSISVSAVINQDNTTGWMAINDPVKWTKGGSNEENAPIGTMSGTVVATIRYSVENFTHGAIEEGHHPQFVLHFETTISTSSTPIPSDITVVIDKKPMRTVTYHDDYNHTSGTVQYPDGTYITANSWKTMGSNFIGWYLDDEFTNAFDYNLPVTKDMDLYARFAFVVTFDYMNGNSSKMYVLADKDGSMLSAERVPHPTYFGYDLVGWYKDKNLIVEWDYAFDSVKDDTTLYAKWKGTEVKINFWYPVGNEYVKFQSPEDKESAPSVEYTMDKNAAKKTIYRSGDQYFDIFGNEYIKNDEGYELKPGVVAKYGYYKDTDGFIYVLEGGKYKACNYDGYVMMWLDDTPYLPIVRYGSTFDTIDTVQSSKYHTPTNILDYAKDSVQKKLGNDQFIRWQVYANNDPRSGVSYGVYSDTTLISGMVNLDKIGQNGMPEIDLYALTAKVAISLTMNDNTEDATAIVAAPDNFLSYPTPSKITKADGDYFDNPCPNHLENQMEYEKVGNKIKYVKYLDDNNSEYYKVKDYDIVIILKVTATDKDAYSTITADEGYTIYGFVESLSTVKEISESGGVIQFKCKDVVEPKVAIKIKASAFKPTGSSISYTIEGMSNCTVEGYVVENSSPEIQASLSYSKESNSVAFSPARYINSVGMAGFVMNPEGTYYYAQDEAIYTLYSIDEEKATASYKDNYNNIWEVSADGTQWIVSREMDVEHYTTDKEGKVPYVREDLVKEADPIALYYNEQEVAKVSRSGDVITYTTVEGSKAYYRETLFEVGTGTDKVHDWMPEAKVLLVERILYVDYQDGIKYTIDKKTGEFSVFDEYTKTWVHCDKITNYYFKERDKYSSPSSMTERKDVGLNNQIDTSVPVQGQRTQAVSFFTDDAIKMVSQTEDVGTKTVTITLSGVASSNTALDTNLWGAAERDAGYGFITMNLSGLNLYTLGSTEKIIWIHQMNDALHVVPAGGDKGASTYETKSYDARIRSWDFSVFGENNYGHDIGILIPKGTDKNKIIIEVYTSSTSATGNFSDDYNVLNQKTLVVRFVIDTSLVTTGNTADSDRIAKGLGAEHIIDAMSAADHKVKIYADNGIIVTQGSITDKSGVKESTLTLSGTTANNTVLDSGLLSSTWGRTTGYGFISMNLKGLGINSGNVWIYQKSTALSLGESEDQSSQAVAGTQYTERIRSWGYSVFNGTTYDYDLCILIPQDGKDVTIAIYSSDSAASGTFDDRKTALLTMNPMVRYIIKTSDVKTVVDLDELVVKKQSYPIESYDRINSEYDDWTFNYSSKRLSGVLGKNVTFIGTDVIISDYILNDDAAAHGLIKSSAGNEFKKIDDKTYGMVNWDLAKIKITLEDGKYRDQFGNIWEKTTEKTYELVRCDNLLKDGNNGPVRYVADRNADAATITWTYYKYVDGTNDEKAYKEVYDIRTDQWQYYKWNDAGNGSWDVCFKDNDYYLLSKDPKDSARYSKVGDNQFGIHEWKIVFSEIQEKIGDNKYLDQFGNEWHKEGNDYILDSSRVWIFQKEYLETYTVANSGNYWLIEETSYGEKYAVYKETSAVISKTDASFTALFASIKDICGLTDATLIGDVKLIMLKTTEDTELFREYTFGATVATKIYTVQIFAKQISTPAIRWIPAFVQMEDMDTGEIQYFMSSNASLVKSGPSYVSYYMDKYQNRFTSYDNKDYACVEGSTTYYEFTYRLNEATRNGYKLTGWHNTHVNSDDALYPSSGLSRTMKIFYNIADNHVVINREVLNALDSSGKTVDYITGDYNVYEAMNDQFFSYASYEGKALPRLDDISKMYNIMYDAIWEPMTYTITVTDSANGYVDAFLIKDGKRTPITGSQKVSYGDRIELLYSDLGKYSFSRWVTTGECEIQDEYNVSTTLVVHGNCSVVATDISERVVNLSIRFDAGRLPEHDREHHVDVYLRNTLDKTKEYKLTHYDWSTEFESYSGYVPLTISDVNEGYQVVVKYKNLKNDVVTETEEYPLTGFIKVDMESMLEFTYDVISARIVESITTTNHPALEHSYVLHDGVDKIDWEGAHRTENNVRMLNKIVVGDVTVASVTRYVGVDSSYLERSDVSYIINNPENGISPVVLTIKDGYQYTVLEGFPDQEGGTHYDINFNYNYHVGYSDVERTEYFNLNWTRTDRPADIIVMMVKVNEAPSIHLTFEADTPVQNHAFTGSTELKKGDSLWNEVTNVSMSSPFTPAFSEEELETYGIEGWYIDAAMTKPVSPNMVLDNDIITKIMVVDESGNNKYILYAKMAEKAGLKSIDVLVTEEIIGSYNDHALRFQCPDTNEHAITLKVKRNSDADCAIRSLPESGYTITGIGIGSTVSNLNYADNEVTFRCAEGDKGYSVVFKVRVDVPGEYYTISSTNTENCSIEDIGSATIPLNLTEETYEEAKERGLNKNMIYFTTTGVTEQSKTGTFVVKLKADSAGTYNVKPDLGYTITDITGNGISYSSGQLTFSSTMETFATVCVQVNTSGEYLFVSGTGYNITGVVESSRSGVVSAVDNSKYSSWGKINGRDDVGLTNETFESKINGDSRIIRFYSDDSAMFTQTFADYYNVNLNLSGTTSNNTVLDSGTVGSNWGKITGYGFFTINFSGLNLTGSDANKNIWVYQKNTALSLAANGEYGTAAIENSQYTERIRYWAYTGEHGLRMDDYQSDLGVLIPQDGSEIVLEIYISSKTLPASYSYSDAKAALEAIKSESNSFIVRYTIDTSSIKTLVDLDSFTVNYPISEYDKINVKYDDWSYDCANKKLDGEIRTNVKFVSKSGIILGNNILNGEGSRLSGDALEAYIAQHGLDALSKSVVTFKTDDTVNEKTLVVKIQASGRGEYTIKATGEGYSFKNVTTTDASVEITKESEGVYKLKIPDTKVRDYTITLKADSTDTLYLIPYTVGYSIVGVQKEASTVTIVYTSHMYLNLRYEHDLTDNVFKSDVQVNKTEGSLKFYAENGVRVVKTSEEGKDVKLQMSGVTSNNTILDSGTVGSNWGKITGYGFFTINFSGLNLTGSDANKNIWVYQKNTALSLAAAGEYGTEAIEDSQYTERIRYWAYSSLREDYYPCDLGVLIPQDGSEIVLEIYISSKTLPASYSYSDAKAALEAIKSESNSFIVRYTIDTSSIKTLVDLDSLTVGYPAEPYEKINTNYKDWNYSYGDKHLTGSLGNNVIFHGKDIEFGNNIVYRGTFVLDEKAGFTLRDFSTVDVQGINEYRIVRNAVNGEVRSISIAAFVEPVSGKLNLYLDRNMVTLHINTKILDEYGEKYGIEWIDDTYVAKFEEIVKLPVMLRDDVPMVAGKAWSSSPYVEISETNTYQVSVSDRSDIFLTPKFQEDQLVSVTFTTSVGNYDGGQHRYVVEIKKNKADPSFGTGSSWNSWTQLIPKNAEGFTFSGYMLDGVVIVPKDIKNVNKDIQLSAIMSPTYHNFTFAKHEGEDMDASATNDSSTDMLTLGSNNAGLEHHSEISVVIKPTIGRTVAVNEINDWAYMIENVGDSVYRNSGTTDQFGNCYDGEGRLVYYLVWVYEGTAKQDHTRGHYTEYKILADGSAQKNVGTISEQVWKNSEAPSSYFFVLTENQVDVTEGEKVPGLFTLKSYESGHDEQYHYTITHDGKFQKVKWVSFTELGEPVKLSDERGYMYTFFLDQDIDITLHTTELSVNISFVVNGVPISSADISEGMSAWGLDTKAGTQYKYGNNVPMYERVMFCSYDSEVTYDTEHSKYNITNGTLQWYTDRACMKPLIPVSDEGYFYYELIATEDITLYTVEDVVITQMFDCNKNLVRGFQLVKDNGLITLPGIKLPLTGHLFAGWGTEAGDCYVFSYAAGSTIPYDGSRLDLYAYYLRGGANQTIPYDGKDHPIDILTEKGPGTILQSEAINTVNNLAYNSSDSGSLSFQCPDNVSDYVVVVPVKADASEPTKVLTLTSSSGYKIQSYGTGSTVKDISYNDGVISFKCPDNTNVYTVVVKVRADTAKEACTIAAGSGYKITGKTNDTMSVRVSDDPAKVAGDESLDIIIYRDFTSKTVYYSAKITTDNGSGSIAELTGSFDFKITKVELYVIAPSAVFVTGDGKQHFVTSSQVKIIAATADGIVPNPEDIAAVVLDTTMPGYSDSIDEVGSVRTAASIYFAEGKAENYIIHYVDGSLILYPNESARYMYGGI